MKLHELSSPAGSKKSVKRIGRGAASGQGKTAGKGHTNIRLTCVALCSSLL